MTGRTENLSGWGAMRTRIKNLGLLEWDFYRSAKLIGMTDEQAMELIDQARRDREKAK